MIDYSEFRRVIEDYLKNNFTLVPIVFENIKLKAVNTEHLEIADSDVESARTEMSSDIREVRGFLVLMIFTKYGSGTEKARDIATQLDSLLKDQIPGVTFEEPEFLSIGLKEGTELYQHNLTVPYAYFYGQDDSN